MSETAKTFIFVAVGLAAVVVAVSTRPSAVDVDIDSLVGEVLTKEFTSASDAKRLRIVRFDDESAELKTFEVAEQNGLWTLPSKDGYPADATKQMADAATSLMDRKILEVTSEIATDHEQFGVIDPLAPTLAPGQKGVGARVTISDAKDQPLVDLIIGKEVKDSPGKRFVRKASQALVYVIEVDPTHLSTKFEDWIEKDLLKFTAFDLQQVEIKDYSAELKMAMTARGLEPVPTWDPRAEMTLAFDDKESKWNPVRLRAYKAEANGYTDFHLAEDEELSATALNGLKDALGTLKIVDVARKPPGMSEDLKTGDDFMNNKEGLSDLMRRGFTAAQTTPGGPRELISSDGEVVITMKNGAEYVLRFGDLVQVDDAQAPIEGEAAKAETKAAPATGDKSGIHRYLFAMARFNESAVKKPELAELPELPAGAATPSTPSDDKSTPTTPVGDPASAGGNGAGDPPAPFVSQDESQPTTAQSQAEAKQNEAKQESNEKTSDSKSGTETKSGDDAALAKLIADRKRIEAENQHKLDDYQATLTKGREKVKELNLRFGDWYFVVGNDVFTKIRLGRDAVIKKKDAKEATPAADGKDAGNSMFGPPGTRIPGLPNLGGDGK